MSEFLEKLCCCIPIKIGGYLLGSLELVNLGLLIVFGINIAEQLEHGVDVVGKGKNKYNSKLINLLK